MRQHKVAASQLRGRFLNAVKDSKVRKRDLTHGVQNTEMVSSANSTKVNESVQKLCKATAVVQFNKVGLLKLSSRLYPVLIRYGVIQILYFILQSILGIALIPGLQVTFWLQFLPLWKYPYTSRISNLINLRRSKVANSEFMKLSCFVAFYLPNYQAWEHYILFKTQEKHNFANDKPVTDVKRLILKCYFDLMNIVRFMLALWNIFTF